MTITVARRLALVLTAASMAAGLAAAAPSPDSRTSEAEPPAVVTDRMKLVFEDTFDGDHLDLAKWFPGPKPDGGQWGGAHFVSVQDSRFPTVYLVKDGTLTLRAHHDPQFADPEHWGRTWYSGQVSTAFPDKPAPSAIRTGYIETRARFPRNKGSWPGFWMLAPDLEPTTAPDPGGVEIDGFEFYGDAVSKFSSGVIYWPGKTGRPSEPGKLLWTDTHPDLTEGFHTYGVQITQTEVIVFFDRKEVQRMPLPRTKTVGKFFVLLDNAIHTDHGVDIPASGYADATFDYVRVWSAD